MKLRLNRTQSIIFTVCYIAITLAIRFILEPFLLGYYLISVGIGLYFILLLWVLWYKKIINFSK